MRHISYAMLVSLDGFITDPQGQIDWILMDEELHRFFNQRERGVDTCLYGRRMYEAMHPYWSTADKNPSATDVEVEFARIWQPIPKVVFSSTLDHVEGNARLVKSDAVQEVARLKQLAGGEMEVGGATLAASLMQAGLIDEIELYLQPFVLGGGTPMFGPLAEKLDLKLVETHTFTCGVVLARYQR